jgi:hypothetical protein
MSKAQIKMCGCPLLLAAALLFGAMIAPAIAEPDFMPAAPEQPARPEPVPIIRFRCEVAPQANTCPETPQKKDSEVCDCAKDFCYTEPSGVRICEKS